MKRAMIASLLLPFFAVIAFAQNPSSETQMKVPPSIEQKTAGMQKFPGFFTYYWDARDGKLWLQIDKWNAQFLCRVGGGAQSCPRARLRPPPKLHVRFSRMQLSRRLNIRRCQGRD